MAGVSQAYQHLFRIDCILLFRLTRRVAVCIVELFSGQVTSFISLIQLSFIQ